MRLIVHEQLGCVAADTTAANHADTGADRDLYCTANHVGVWMTALSTRKVCQPRCNTGGQHDLVDVVNIVD